MTTTTTITYVATDLIAELERAWNHADGTAFAARFTADADFVNILGTHAQGRAAIAAGHQGIFDTIYQGSVVRYSLDTVRPVAPGCLVAVVSATLEVPAGPLAGTVDARFTATLVDDAGTWGVAAFHNTVVQPER